MSTCLTTDGLKKFFSTSGGPLRPEARGICHIYHMVNPALSNRHYHRHHYRRQHRPMNSRAPLLQDHESCATMRLYL